MPQDESTAEITFTIPVKQNGMPTMGYKTVHLVITKNKVATFPGTAALVCGFIFIISIMLILFYKINFSANTSKELN